MASRFSGYTTLVRRSDSPRCRQSEVPMSIVQRSDVVWFEYESNIIMEYKLVIIYKRESLLCCIFCEQVCCQRPIQGLSRATHILDPPLCLYSIRSSPEASPIFFCTLQVLPFTFSCPPLTLALHFFPFHFFKHYAYTYTGTNYQVFSSNYHLTNPNLLNTLST